MKQASPLHSSYAALFDPAVALAAAKRAAQWDLPRHICHPLDRYTGRRVNADLAAFDEAVDLAPVSEEALEETLEEAFDDRSQDTSIRMSDADDGDFDDADDQ